MRKIEQDMCRAIRNRETRTFNNTTVVNGLDTAGRPIVEVLLHGNLIARFKFTESMVQIFDGEWQTVTTKSRLNAILRDFTTGCSVYQKKGVWYLACSNDSDVLFYDGLHLHFNL